MDRNFIYNVARRRKAGETILAIAIRKRCTIEKVVAALVDAGLIPKRQAGMRVANEKARFRRRKKP
jgi:hypothetical protein